VVHETPVIFRLDGDDILEEAMRRAGLEQAPIAPIEATAALAMLLLRDHGVLTVHFAGLPPGTSALLIKFIPPEVLERFGGAGKFANAIDACLSELARLLDEPESVRSLLLGVPVLVAT
jgi:L-seryl-tRNA(Ser) seleniumtransferase